MKKAKKKVKIWTEEEGQPDLFSWFSWLASDACDASGVCDACDASAAYIGYPGLQSYNADQNHNYGLLKGLK